MSKFSEQCKRIAEKFKKIDKEVYKDGRVLKTYDQGSK